MDVSDERPAVCLFRHAFSSLKPADRQFSYVIDLTPGYDALNQTRVVPFLSEEPDADSCRL
jgi:hypothetical protein